MTHTERASLGRDTMGGDGMYDVVLLIESEICDGDAAEVVGLRNQSAGEPTRYWVLLPVDDAAARVEGSLGTLAANEPFGAAPVLMPELDLEQIQREILDASRSALTSSLERLRAHGAHADGEITNLDPVEALAKAVAAHQAAEVNILTRPHLVSEFFHVDWASKARRRLGVPLLHLIEQGVRDAAGDRDGESACGSGDAPPAGQA